MLYFTADLHLAHENIIKFCNRPFKNAGNMQKELTKNWNSVVKNHSDKVYILGDFSLRGKDYSDWYINVLRRLRGRKILILGNHDKIDPFTYVDLGFESVHTSIILEEKILLCHDPAWSVAVPKNWITLCGHVHDAFKYLHTPRQVVNVGIDVWDYKPVSFNQIFQYTLLHNPDSVKGGHRCDFLKEMKE